MEFLHKAAKWIRGIFVTAGGIVLTWLLLRVFEIDDVWYWVLDKAVGEQAAKTFVADVVQGKYDRQIAALLFTVFLLGCFAWIFDPAREALRRYRTPNGGFWSKKKLLMELESIAGDLENFVRERDSLNIYVLAPNIIEGNASGGIISPGAYGNVISGEGANPNVVKLAQMTQDQARIYDTESRDLFMHSLAGRIACAIKEADSRGLIVGEDEKRILASVYQLDSFAPRLLRKVYAPVIALLRACALRMSEN